MDEVVAPEELPPGRKPWTEPRWNIAPTDQVAAVVERLSEDHEPRRTLVGLHWGLVPSWAKDPGGAARLVNARLETVAEKPSFRKAFRARRCLLPADGYYEWYASPGAPARSPKQPFFIHPADGLMAMAGIYEFWKSPEGKWLSSCSIITTAATDDLGRIHDRMPVQVAPHNWAAWLDPGLQDAQTALELVHVPAPGEMSAYAVSRRVSNVRNDGPELVEPLREEDA